LFLLRIIESVLLEIFNVLTESTFKIELSAEFFSDFSSGFDTSNTKSSSG
jgi:hypothetical protein